MLPPFVTPYVNSCVKTSFKPQKVRAYFDLKLTAMQITTEKHKSMVSASNKCTEHIHSSENIPST